MVREIATIHGVTRAKKGATAMQQSDGAHEDRLGPAEIAGGLVGGFSGAVAGSTIGAAFGSILGPIGTAVGYTVGGKVGAMVGMIKGAQNPGGALLSGAKGTAGFIEEIKRS
jgi:phage tail tape-measure protein